MHLPFTCKPSRLFAAVMAITMLASSAFADEIVREDVILKNTRLTISKISREMKNNFQAASPSTERRSLGETYLFCDMISAALKCGSHDIQGACNSETDCKWDPNSTEDSKCGISDEKGEEAGKQLTAGVLLLLGPMITCAASTDVASCTADVCTVYSDTCMISDASVDSAFSDPSVAELLKMSLRCGAHEDQSNCNAASDCSWKLDDDADSDTSGENTCQVADDSTMAIVSKFCILDPDTGTFKSKDLSGAASVSHAALAIASCVVTLAMFL